MGFTFTGTTSESAIRIDGASPTICGNHFTGCVNNDQDQTIIRKIAGSPKIMYNLFYDNPNAWGIMYASGDSLEFVNNTVVSGKRGLPIYCDNAVVKNNIVTGLSSYGINDGGSSLIIGFNDIWNNNDDYYGNMPQPPDDISEDPLFIDMSIDDYHLSGNSPCVDAGDPDPQYNDHDGTRSDIGAYSIFHSVPSALNLNYGNQAYGDTVHTLVPNIYWVFYDTLQVQQAGFHIQVGNDDDWTVVEMWDTGEISSLDTSVTYTGNPLSNNTEYYLRIRVNNGIEWGEWRENQFYTHLQVLNVPSDYATIQNAIDASFNFDTILMNPGQYYENLLIQDKDLTLMSLSGPENTCISKAYDGFPILSVEATELRQITVIGLTLENAIGDVGIYLEDNIIGVIKSNIIKNCNYGISYGNSTTSNDLIIIDSNVIYNCADAIHLDTDIATEIANNTLYQNSWGVFCSGLGSCYIYNNIISNGSRGMRVRHTANSLIKNNTIDNQSANGIEIIDGGTHQIKNNIVLNCTGYGIMVDYDPDDVILKYNDFYNNTQGNYFGVIPDEGNISEDPQFSGIPGNEYYLLGSSPCIDAGDPTDPVPDGGGDRIDMGALEYTGLILDFSLLNPADSTVLFTYSPTFEWEELPSGTEYGQLSYSLIIDDAENFSSPLEYDAGISAMYSIPDPLANYGFWHWKVKAYNDTAAFWSNEVFAFRIDYTPNLPQLISPIHGEATYADYWLLWTESYDADADDTVTYTLEIDNNSDFSSPEATESSISSESGQKDGIVGIHIQDLQNLANLQDNTTYYWRVKAVDKFGGESGFTDGTATFHYNPQTSEPTAPGMPTIVSPADGEEAVPDSWLTWEESVDPDVNDTVAYTIEIDDNNDFLSPEVTQSGITDTPGKSLAGVQINTLTDYNNLQDDITYFWRIKAVDKYALESAFTDGTAHFMYNSVNSQPNPPTAGFSPSNDFTINNLLPTISWYPGTDPDPSDNSAALHYELWIDDDGEFDTSVQFTYMTAPGTPLVILTDSLTDETHWDYIVRTIDDQGLESYWSSMQGFWTNSRNDTPMVFQANYPDAQIIYEMLPEFAWETSVETDPLDSVYYKFYLAVDPNFQFVNVIDSIWDTTFIRLDSLAFGEEYWWKVKALDNTNLPRFSSNVASFRTWKLGDVNTNWTVDILDIVYLVNYKFKGGPAPAPMFSGDMDGNCTINILDIVYLVNYKFKTGSEPLVGCE